MAYRAYGSLYPQYSYTSSDKEFIKTAIQTPLSDRVRWYLLSAKWFEKWKVYVDFDSEDSETRSKEEIEALRPGPIDNTDLFTPGTEKLRKGLIEKKDYEVIPESAWSRLLLSHKGGPGIGKSVVNIGTADMPLYQVEVYLLPFQVYFVGKPTSPLSDPLDWSVSKNCTFGIVGRDVMRTRQLYSQQYRCWVKAKPQRSADQIEGDATLDDTLDEPPSTLPPPPPTETDGASNRQEQSSRNVKRTADAVEVDGLWRLYRKPDRVSVMDICVDDGRPTEMIVEYVDSYYGTASEHSWPRAKLVEAWKNDLQVGDCVDAQDSHYKWFEAVIKETKEDGVVVHFKGWGPEFDEVIPKEKIPFQIQPLYSYTRNWRSMIDEDDKLDVSINVPTEDGTVGKAVWVVGVVQEINVPEKRVLMSYCDNDIAAASGEASKPVTSADDIDDDKPLVLTNTAKIARLEDADDAKVPAKTVEKVNNRYTVWKDIDGDELCELYVHTPKPKYSVYSGSVWDRDEYGEKNTTGKPMTKGAVGLVNLGNTCFMNSILQCLSNTMSLTEVFVSNRYKSQLNVENRLGHGGKVATSYAKLMKDMWCDGYTKVVPRNFKKTIGEFQPQFAGYQQQDSQELMGFLLDGLHEDLNRILKLPYVQKIDSNGRPDELIARESWRRFLLRNDSELVDRVYGQLRSHVTCVKCGKESVTFDAFNCLSLPVPVDSSKIITVMVHLLPIGNAPVKVDIAVEATHQIRDLRQLVLDKLRRAGRLKGYDIRKAPVTEEVVASAVVQATKPRVENSHWAGLEEETMNVDMEAFLPAATDKMPPATTADTGAIPAGMDAYQKRCAEIARGAILDPVFHIATQPDYDQYRVTRNLDDKAPVGDLLRGRENLVLFQLEHPCQYKSTKIPGGYVSYVDLYFCIRKVEYGQERLDPFSYPVRVNITRETSGEDMYLIADKLFLRYCNEGTDYYNNPDNRPFDLLRKGYLDPNSKKVLGQRDRDPLNLLESEMIVILLKSEANTRAIISVPQIKLTEKLTVSDDSDDEATDPEGEVMSNLLTDPTATVNRKGKKSAQLSVYKCLEKFIEKERLNDAETIYCSNCKEHIAPFKKMDLWATPDILIIHLKRFRYIPGQYFVHREKISDLIDFPIDSLDLSSYIQGPKDPAAPPIYDLYGVSHHSGGLGGGHYTAVCKNPLNEKWYSFNDSFVSETTPQAAVNELAYVLFYKRKQGELRWAGIKPLEEGLPDDP